MVSATIVNNSFSYNQKNGGYLNENGGLNIGGPSTDTLDAVGSFLTQKGFGLGNDGIDSQFDIRSSLAGRVLGATGAINDTPLGIIGGQQLLLALGQKAAFNVQKEILGKKKINNEVVDTLSLARDKFPGSPVSLDALCKRYRVDNSNRAKHTALIDCDLLAKVYINLTDQKEPTLNFKNEDNEKIIINSNDTNQYYKKIVKPSEEEIKTQFELQKIPEHLKKIEGELSKIRAEIKGLEKQTDL